KNGFFYENLFATESGNGWYLIVGINDTEMYREAYAQLFVTILLSLALFTVIIILYVASVRSRERAEEALYSRERFLTGITHELQEPLNRILEHAKRGTEGRTTDHEEEMEAIHRAATTLSEMIGQILSYKDIVLSNEDRDRQKVKTSGVDRRYRTIILVVMVLVMLISVYVNIHATYRWGNTRMASEVNAYEYQLSEWLNTQKSILDMFASVISTNPEMLDDYDGMIRWLDRITVQYPEISVTYMTNPDLAHTVYMNNGWEPDENWHVEERQWYVDTMSSEEGFSVSAPYYDEQTGGYCVTISKAVYDAKSGVFLGVFGIDFFMDKLVDILGDSYFEDGYAFLVDPTGRIINHPYGEYQMSQHRETNIAALPYGQIRADGKTILFFKDYDGTAKTLIAVRNADSNFSVYVVRSAVRIYGQVVLTGLISMILFLFCIVFVYRLLTGLISWQEEVNRRLSESAEAAIEAGRAKSTFLAQMSHEIRTPINAVLGMNEMILRESEDSGIREYAANIRSAGRTLLSLINSILDFSKIEDGKMELVPAVYDTSSLINDLVNSISDRAKAKGLTFHVQVDRNLPVALYGDDVRIKQVIMNILTNAVKYTEKGSVTMIMEARERKQDRLRIYVSVKDTGIGIKKEDMSRLFESFERLDEIRNRNIEGTGLGMAITTKLLKMMGSELCVESCYGEGSNFYFELEQKIMDEEPIGDFTRRIPKAADSGQKGKYLKAEGAAVLVVDDNEMNRKVAKSLMKRNGIQPDLAESGEEAIRMMAERRYDIVFLDHMMPKMDGIETLARLKETGGIPKGCAMIALTANATSGARERYMEAGFDDYLSKPIDVEALERKLFMWLPEQKAYWTEAGETERIPSASEQNEAHGVTADVTEEGADGEGLDGEGSDAEELFEFLPEDAGAEAEPVMIDQEENTIGKLKRLGLDTEAALGFCGGEVSFYEELLFDFAEGCAEKKKELDESLSAKDWRAFEVKIHALKSMTKTIGMMDLSNMAFGLEKAAEEMDEARIMEGYPVFAAGYAQMAEDIRTVLKK
ncbi:MAG: response regulator, partial [Lachnospiraceae bacterium]|nr:response regulator [Lachnospiraceae bacterium]